MQERASYFSSKTIRYCSFVLDLKLLDCIIENFTSNSFSSWPLLRLLEMFQRYTEINLIYYIVLVEHKNRIYRSVFITTRGVYFSDNLIKE